MRSCTGESDPSPRGTPRHLGTDGERFGVRLQDASVRARGGRLCAWRVRGEAVVGSPSGEGRLSLFARTAGRSRTARAISQETRLGFSMDGGRVPNRNRGSSSSPGLPRAKHSTTPQCPRPLNPPHVPIVWGTWHSH